MCVVYCFVYFYWIVDDCVLWGVGYLELVVWVVGVLLVGYIDVVVGC